LAIFTYFRHRSANRIVVIAKPHVRSPIEAFSAALCSTVAL